ncbi:MAG TPA: folylpolyglutamate synthase/dihydrofolate synthase family protein [Candidatus Acidoferrales bacterium]|jgi:dihydrofolate synthase/folylpolyglutamate synthase|nr:folylpolyglutamate synthase/dihydrofolate synthase family protein [Candidatus Acidoferrales bacterium]
MNYEQTVRSLYALGRELGAPRQARLQKFGLDNISILAAHLGNPQLSIPCVHIAGTNGKGSTAAMLESILRTSGLRTGLYTSPHLESVNERIRINGENISDAAFADIWTRVQAAIERLMAFGTLASHPTFFECVTAIAFVAFAERGVEFAVYEVGMGGRWDATNIVRPEIGVITQIDFDHENFLGHSIEEIAGEKAGIIKSGMWIVSSIDRPEALKVVSAQCDKVGAKLFDVDKLWRMDRIEPAGDCYRAAISELPQGVSLVLEPSLPGKFQIRNALAAATVAKLLWERGGKVNADDIPRGIATAQWPGRLERLSEQPTLYLDGTHNPAGARELLRFWNDNFKDRKIILVYGAMRDKAVDEIAGLLFPRVDFVILTEPRQPRAVSASLLAGMTSHFAKSLSVIPDPVNALETALRTSGPADAVFATGSLFLVGELRGYWHRRNFEQNPVVSGQHSR